ncbi:MAG: hypothetical protein CMG71_06125 [Candidatus Marinimicrobia bacterium]|nr:hypothetical protein [Candidatus Neomarinimicrobiota bacterium]|tara:strand:+ start:11907 stop:12233 length:327 start_codon:yes stop_codon:yes gene_type:complete
MKRPLYDIAHSRSGDKGPNTNVGLIFNSVEAYDWGKRVITEKRVKEYFGDVVKGEVVRYELPNLWALNFILQDSLSGGGSETLQLDAQGKTYGQHLLRMELDIPDELL